MTKRDVSRRSLSFLLAERLGNQQESEYRSLGKYLSGSEEPGPKKAAAIAEVLETPEVGVVAKTRRDRLEALERRLEELEAAVSARQQKADAFGEKVLERLVALEDAREPQERPSSPRESGREG
jgi:hypothetical protein